MEIEVIPFALAGRVPARLGSLRRRSAAGHPQEIALELLGLAGLTPLLLHSTSWRHEDGLVILTYAAVVADAPAAGLHPVWSVPLARGSALAPPDRIEEEQVAAHALLHLAWLAGHDAAVAAALPAAWRRALAADPEALAV